MIRRLRTRFVIFNMLIVAVLLLAMMFMALRFNRYTLRQRSIASLERIAAVINYSTRHTARLIKSIYGASLSEIRRSRKNK